MVTQTAMAAALARRRYRILALVKTELRLCLTFSRKKLASFVTLYSVMYLISHSRTLGSAKP